MTNPYHYRRNLPRILPPGRTAFVTFRLAGSLPKAVAAQLHEEERLSLGDEAASVARRKRYFGKLEQYLDVAQHGPTWLRLPEVAQAVINALRYFDGTACQLLSYCLMPNHVHLVVVIAEGGSVPMIQALQRVKSFSAWEANRLSSAKGSSGTGKVSTTLCGMAAS